MASGSPETGKDCPDAEILSAFAERTLSVQEARDVERHVASCRSCARVVAMVIASEPALVAATPHRGLAARRWVVPLATAATVAGVWVALTRDQIPPEPAPSVTSAPSAPSAAPFEPEALDPASRENASTPATDTAAAARRAAEAALPAPGNARGSETLQAPPPSVPVTVQGEAPLVERDADPQVAPTVALRGRVVAVPSPPAALAETISVIPSIEVSSPIAPTRWRARGNVIERSTDGGTTWSTDYTAARDVLAGAAVNGDIVWMVGRQGLVLRRSPSGWTVATAPTSADLSAVEAASLTEATVRLASGAGFHTVDGGATWTPR